MTLNMIIWTSRKLSQVVTSVSMEDSQPATSKQHQCVEEEYTIQVPLVRPNQRFQEVLRLAGATKETFTKKEICHYLKDYISSRQLYDIGDPRIVHCKDDILGEVFGVKKFTINEVLGLLDKNCTELADRCVRRKRRIVSEPIPLSSSSSPVTIAVCYADTHGTATDLIASATFQRDGKVKSKTTGSSFVTCSHGKAGYQQGSNKDDCKVSSTCQRKNSTSEETSSDGTKRQKRKKKSKDNSNSSPRKRHHTEPSSSEPQTQQQTPGGSSRRRGASLSITCGTTEGGDNEGGFPWYFQVELSDEGEEEKSEVLSVQGKETVTVRDSTDDLWFVEDALESDVEFSVEYEVESDSPELTESDITSVRSGEGGLLVVCKESDVEFFADYSDSESNTDDKELSEADNWICQECNLSNQPYQRYCDRCWKLRADWLPSGPSYYDLDSKPKQDTVPSAKDKTITEKNDKSAAITDVLNSDIKDRVPDRTIKMNETTDSGFGSSTQPSSQETVLDKPTSDPKLLGLPNVLDKGRSYTSLIEDSSEQRYSFSSITLAGDHQQAVDSSVEKEDLSQGLKSARTPLDDPCIICLTKPKTASLIHGLSGHQVCCFSCAKRLKRRGKVCPVCRRPIQKVVKNYIL